MGKTTLVNIVSKTLGLPMREIIGETDSEKILEIIMDLKGGILFIDEIHSLKTESMEKLYSLMEDFKYEGEKISEFTLFGATTEIGELIKRAKPFYDRFKIILELENYSILEMKKMARGYRERKYPSDFLENKILETLAKNCKLTPRNLIRLIDTVISFDKDVKATLKSFNIIHNGFTIKDLQILKYLETNKKGVGLQGIATYLNTSSQNYLYESEPYLIQNELILRLPKGRVITEKGKRLIKQLEKRK